MSNVVRFPQEQRSKPILRMPNPRKNPKGAVVAVPYGSLGLGDMEGYRPLGHPEIEYGPRGKVLLAEKQIWVEDDTSLWVIRSIEYKNKGRKNERVRVYLGRYQHGPYVCLVLSESRLRHIMKIWEQAFEEWLEEWQADMDSETDDRIE